MDNSPFAGLWESSRRDDGVVVESFTIITMPANELMAEIHNSKKRMTLILARDAYQDWLAGTEDEAEKCLAPYPSEIMDAYRISTYVNSPTHDDPRCVEPLVG